MNDNKYDFSGWATKNDMECADGRVIRRDAFKHCDGKVVPLVWNHDHSSPENILGNARLKNTPEGIYAYCSLNNTDAANVARTLLKHGDINSLSIFANHLNEIQNGYGKDVYGGDIKEVSLVLSGANPGAVIRDVSIMHSDGSLTEDCIIYTGENLTFAHSDAENADNKPDDEEKITKPDDTKDQQKSVKTIKEIWDAMSDEQRDLVYRLVDDIMREKSENESDDNPEKDTEEENELKHNVFDAETGNAENVLQHDDMMVIMSDGKRYGSLKESFLQHGITNVGVLFPDAKPVGDVPQLITRDMNWVEKVMQGVHHSPFSRVKSIYANLTEDEARAKGYIKGNLKKEQVFSLLKRTTDAQTIYKKQKIDRDDMVDITDLDVVKLIKDEMAIMLDEELARAILIGDGRETSSDDKISEDHIRPILTDAELYTIHEVIDEGSNDYATAKNMIRGAVKGRKKYKGSGHPILFTTEDWLTNCLLLEDKNERVIYDSMEKLATAMRVSSIETVPPMEGMTRTASDGTKYDVLGIIVNLADYNVGTDRGGEKTLFDDFDIDYNQMKYLIETRCSGALTKPYSAIVLEKKASSDSSDDSSTEGD